MGSEFQVIPSFSTAKRRTRNSDDCRAPRSASGPENEREPVIRRLFRSKRTRNSAYRKSKLRLRAADSRVKQTSTRTVLKPNAVRPFRDESARRRISPRRSSSRPRPYLPSTRSDNSTPRCAANSVRPPETVELAQRVRFTRAARNAVKKAHPTCCENRRFRQCESCRFRSSAATDPENRFFIIVHFIPLCRAEN